MIVRLRSGRPSWMACWGAVSFGFDDFDEFRWLGLCLGEMMAPLRTLKRSLQPLVLDWWRGCTFQAGF